MARLARAYLGGATSGNVAMVGRAVRYSTQRAARTAELHEVMLDQADGLDWESLCKCDVVYAAPKTDLIERRGSATAERRRAIAERVVRSLGLTGL